MVQARIIAAQDLQSVDIAGAARGAIVVEDADQIAGNPKAEEALFHLHNLALQQGAPVLITSKAPPIRWGLGLPDLQSRMQGSALVSLAAPDDALLAAVLVKLFRDRQIALDADLLPYLMLRMDRSFAAAGQLVAALDQVALAQKRRITKALAGPVLDKLAHDSA